MRDGLRVLARLDHGWPVWTVRQGRCEQIVAVISSWQDLEALVLSHASAEVDLSFGEDALVELVLALGAPPWTDLGAHEG